MAPLDFPRPSRVPLWVFVGLTVGLPLVAHLAMAGKFPSGETCTPAIAQFEFLRLSCGKLRLLSLALSAIAAFATILVAYWFWDELIGLRRLFEAPWFGVGDDVENVGVLEAII